MKGRREIGPKEEKRRRDFCIIVCEVSFFIVLAGWVIGILAKTF